MRSIVAMLMICIISVMSTTTIAANLTGEEIENNYSGNTNEWQSLKQKPMNPKWRAPWGRTYFSPDGKLEGTIKGKSRTGTWRIDGDQLCINWKKERCRFVEQDGKAGFYGINPKNGKKAVHVKKVHTGKKL